METLLTNLLFKLFEIHGLYLNFLIKLDIKASFFKHSIKVKLKFKSRFRERKNVLFQHR